MLVLRRHYEDKFLLGHGVMFTNDLYPRAINPDGTLQTSKLAM